MKTKYTEKLKKYVEKNRLSKVKYFRRKHDLDLSTAISKDKNTLLHYAYNCGHTEIARLVKVIIQCCCKFIGQLTSNKCILFISVWRDFLVTHLS